MKAVVVALCVCSMSMVTSCASPGGPVTGAWYTSTKGGIGVGHAKGKKTGEACATSILGIIGTGDASISTAKANGGIKRIATADSTHFSILGLYAKNCTVVTGG